MRIIDLSHIFNDKMPSYPGDPKVSLKPCAAIAREGYADHTLKTTLHVGTHIDAPSHMIEGGKRIDELPLELFYGKGVVVDARGKKELDIELSARLNLTGKVEPCPSCPFVFFCTGSSKHYREERYFTDYPSITEELARELVKRKVKMVGLDTPSPDLPAPRARQAGRAPFAVHKILLGAGILIIENLTNLEALLQAETFDVHAFPLRIAADAAPARVIASVGV